MLVVPVLFMDRMTDSCPDAKKLENRSNAEESFAVLPNPGYKNPDDHEIAAKHIDRYAS